MKYKRTHALHDKSKIEPIKTRPREPGIEGSANGIGPVGSPSCPRENQIFWGKNPPKREVAIEICVRARGQSVIFLAHVRGRLWSNAPAGLRKHDSRAYASRAGV